jgi:P-type E1-E2 ATPase
MYIGVEIIRLIQSTIVKYDKYIYDAESKKPAMARTSELCDELGQVDFILSDKTGTLTKNNMILEKISVRDKYFSKEELINYFESRHRNSLISEDSESSNGQESCEINSNSKMVNCVTSNNLKENFMPSKEKSFIISDENLQDKIFYFNADESNSKLIKNYENDVIDFFRLANICNSIVIDYSKNKNSSEVNYQVK